MSRGIDLSALPERYRKQAMAKLQAQDDRKVNAAIAGAVEQVKQNKMRNVVTDHKGIRFQSIKEARRYEELMLLLSAGEISDLKLQESFTLQRPYTTPEGKRIRGVRYDADFTYTQDGERIVEDVKGRKSGTAYNLFTVKKKMMLEILGIEVREV